MLTLQETSELVHDHLFNVPKTYINSLLITYSILSMCWWPKATQQSLHHYLRAQQSSLDSASHTPSRWQESVHAHINTCRRTHSGSTVDVSRDAWHTPVNTHTTQKVKSILAALQRTEMHIISERNVKLKEETKTENFSLTEDISWLFSIPRLAFNHFHFLNFFKMLHALNEVLYFNCREQELEGE